MTTPVTFDAPVLRAEEKAALADFWHFYEPHATAVQDEVIRACQNMLEWGPSSVP